jgi:outer membrane protein
MKNISTILSAIALILIIVLFFLFYNHTEQIKKISVATEKQSASTFKIAYFDLDSLEAHYDYFKDANDQSKEKENAMSAILNGLKKKYEQKIAVWQKKGNTMTPAESQEAQQEYQSMNQEYDARKQELEQDVYKFKDELMNDIKTKIETYLKEYNKQKNYAFIFANSPGSFMYYHDSTYNITGDMINGLNESYKKKN